MANNRLLQYAPAWATAASAPVVHSAPLAPSPAAFVLLPLAAVPAFPWFTPAVLSPAFYLAAYAEAREAVNRYWFGADEAAAE